MRQACTKGLGLHRALRASAPTGLSCSLRASVINIIEKASETEWPAEQQVCTKNLALELAPCARLACC